LVFVVVAAAIITPTGDPFTLSLVAVPMYLFYEVAIIIGRQLVKKRQAAIT
jgi:sec-independent protein translocase protein TatC